jgi:putative transposase
MEYGGEDVMAEERMAGVEALHKLLESAAPDVLREILTEAVTKLMGLEVDALCGAGYGERSAERVNARNGYRSRPWDTRLGTIDLALPKLRQGTYFPGWLLEPRRRAERALVAVVAESYVLGVSTRKVEDLVQTLGIARLSKSQVSELAKSLNGMVASFRERPLDGGPYPYVWLDAVALRCREGGRTVHVAALIAVGVNAEGKREVLGLEVVTGEDGAGWLAFVRGLVARGLGGVQLAISDAHPGLRTALAATLPGAAWQRCRTHFMRNLLTKVPKSAQGLVATLVRTIFAQPDAELTRAQHARVVEQLEPRWPDAARLLADAVEDLLAFTASPKEHWRQIWSNNPQERLNRELKRRTDVVGIFPNRDAVVRLVGAVLAEQHDEWTVVRRYLTVDGLLKPVPVSLPAPDPKETKSKRAA